MIADASAVLCVLGVEKIFNAEERRDTQRTAEMC
jgi:hypothetical protein